MTVHKRDKTRKSRKVAKRAVDFQVYAVKVGAVNMSTMCLKMRIAPSSVFRSVGMLLGLSLLSGCSSFPAPPPVAERPPSAVYPVSEVRLGAFAHDPESPEGGSADLNGEVLFVKPFTSTDPLWNALIPRPHVGGTANFAGKTSQAYAGLTWDYDVTQKVFVEGTFGGSVNDGHAGMIVPPGFNAMGCNESFRESGSLGYRFTENWSLMGTVEHMSNAGLCDRNRGLTNFGARVGYTF
jgi:lipid A 3-O-deacylase